MSLFSYKIRSSADKSVRCISKILWWWLILDKSRFIHTSRRRLSSFSFSLSLMSFCMFCKLNFLAQCNHELNVIRQKVSQFKYYFSGETICLIVNHIDMYTVAPHTVLLTFSLMLVTADFIDCQVLSNPFCWPSPIPFGLPPLWCLSHSYHIKSIIQ